jgi:hypothetical protein
VLHIPLRSFIPHFPVVLGARFVRIDVLVPNVDLVWVTVAATNACEDASSQAATIFVPSVPIHA